MGTKEKCVVCGKHRSATATTFLLNDLAIYRPHCYGCAAKKLVEEHGVDREKIDSRNIKGIAQAVELTKIEKMMQDPKKLKKIMETDPYKEILKEITK